MERLRSTPGQLVGSRPSGRPEPRGQLRPRDDNQPAATTISALRRRARRGSARRRQWVHTSEDAKVAGYEQAPLRLPALLALNYWSPEAPVGSKSE